MQLAPSGGAHASNEWLFGARARARTLQLECAENCPSIQNQER